MRKFLSLLLALVMVLCCIPAMAETADGVYEGTGAGLNGQIKVSVTVSGGKITEVKVLEHSERRASPILRLRRFLRRSSKRSLRTWTSFPARPLPPRASSRR